MSIQVIHFWRWQTNITRLLGTLRKLSSTRTIRMRKTTMLSEKPEAKTSFTMPGAKTMIPMTMGTANALFYGSDLSYSLLKRSSDSAAIAAIVG